MVYGTSHFAESVRNSMLPNSDHKFKPLHFDKNFDKFGRKLRRYLAKSNWYDNDLNIKSSWRNDLPVERRGAKPVQSKLPGMKFSTVIQVQNSKNG